LGIALFPLLWRGLVVAVYERKIYPPTAVPTEQVAIVYGVAVYSTRLSSVLRDRMETAVFLYEQGKVSKLLVSGGYNEPSAMRNYAIERGIPAEDVLEDNAGQGTYDTCYRARHIFGVESAVLVTQEFHLPRARLTETQTTTGVLANLRHYQAQREPRPPNEVRIHAARSLRSRRIILS
jgi:SanA protein